MSRGIFWDQIALVIRTNYDHLKCTNICLIKTSHLSSVGADIGKWHSGWDLEVIADIMQFGRNSGKLGIPNEVSYFSLPSSTNIQTILAILICHNLWLID